MIDPENMRQTVLQWPDLLRRGYSEDLDLPESVREKREIVGAGMGGSAIALGIVGDLLRSSLKHPFEVIRDYQLPGYVGKDSLVIASSYSGSTEETLSAYDQARAAGASIIVVTSGGTLAEKAQTDGVPVVEITLESQPRATLPYGIGKILKLLEITGYIAEQRATVESAAQAVEALGDQPAEATEVAGALKDRLPIVYGGGFLAEASRRLKGQISENAKQTAAFEVVPEQNHNALVGFQFPSSLPENGVFVLLRSQLEHPRHAVRFTIMKEMLKEHKLPFIELWGSGEDPLAHVSTVSFLGDLASVELAYLNGVDPTPVDIITTLKRKLAEA